MPVVVATRFILHRIAGGFAGGPDRDSGASADRLWLPVTGGRWIGRRSQTPRFTSALACSRPNWFGGIGRLCRSTADTAVGALGIGRLPDQPRLGTGDRDANSGDRILDDCHDLSVVGLDSGRTSAALSVAATEKVFA